VHPANILLLAKLPIGDTLLVEPTTRALRARYPEAHIVALTGSTTAQLWRHMPAIDQVVVLPTGSDWCGPRQFIRTLGVLRGRRFDVAIDFTSPAYKWISLVAGIPVRTYMKFDPLWWLIPHHHVRWRATHAARHYFDCARELDLPDWDAFDHVPRLTLPRSAYAAADLLLRQFGGVRPLVGMHPGGTGLAGLKRWPAASFADLAERLHAELGASIVLLGGPDDRDLAAEMKAWMHSTPVNAVGKLPLLATFGLIARCDLLVGNDSSLLHAAAALGTPYVGVIGPTSPANFRPLPTWRGQGRLVLPDPPCREPTAFVGSSVIWKQPHCASCCAALADLPVERVAQACVDQLQHTTVESLELGDARHLDGDLARSRRVQLYQQHPLPLAEHHVAFEDR
jgi:lipopolysaccharide heptosyltransferase II